MTEEDLQKRTNELRKEENRFVNVLNRVTAGRYYNEYYVSDDKLYEFEEQIKKEEELKRQKLERKKYKEDVDKFITLFELYTSKISNIKQSLLNQKNENNKESIEKKIKELDLYENKLFGLYPFAEYKKLQNFEGISGGFNDFTKYIQDTLSIIPQIKTKDEMINYLNKLKEKVSGVYNDNFRTAFTNMIEGKINSINNEKNIDKNKEILSAFMISVNNNFCNLKTKAREEAARVMLKNKAVYTYRAGFSMIYKERPQFLNIENSQTQKQETQKQNMPKEKIKTENKIENSSKINSIQTNTQSLSNSNTTKNKIQVEKKETKELKKKKCIFSNIKNYFKIKSLSKATENFNEKTKSKESGIGK